MGAYLQKTLWILTYAVDWFYFTQCLTSFSSINRLLRLYTQFNSISSNIDDVLLLNTLANVFVFGDFNIHHEDWLTYPGGTDRCCELCYNFSISSDFTQILKSQCAPPLFLLGVDFQGEGLTGSPFLEGDCLERGGELFQGGGWSFSIKIN